MPRVSLKAAVALSLAFPAVVPLLAGCGELGKLGTAAHYPAATSFTVSAPVSTVVIKGGSGSIDVTGSDRSGVRVSAAASYTKTPPKVTHTVSGTTLTMSYSCSAEIVCGVAYTVLVPRGVAVQVSASTGMITLTSLSGPVTARADAGLITAVDLRSVSANLTSNAGGIVATFSVAPASLSAKTDVGSISLTVPGNTAYQVTTHTYVGSATVTVRKSATSAHHISASSDLGTVSISPT